MKKGLLIMTLALLLTLLVAGTALADMPRGMYVNGVELTDDDYWRNGDTTATGLTGTSSKWNAHWDADDLTLTLRDAEIKETFADGGIFYLEEVTNPSDEPETLTIVLKGKNSIRVAGDGVVAVGVHLKIVGSGSLKIVADNSQGLDYGISAFYDLETDGVDLNITSGGFGISVGGNLDILDTDLVIDADGDGIYADSGDIRIEDSELKIIGVFHGIFAWGVIEFEDVQGSVKSTGDDSAAIVSRYADGNVKGITRTRSPIRIGGDVVKLYGPAGEVAGRSVYSNGIDQHIGWTFSTKSKAYLSGQDYENASRRVEFGDVFSDVDPELLLLGLTFLGAGSSFPFVDVPVNSWDYPYIYDAWKLNLIDGVTANLYQPDSSLTYAQSIKLAAVIHQLSVDGAVTTEAGSGSPWYAPYVEYAELNGIINKGQFSGKYGQAISRYDFALIFSQAMPDGYYTPLYQISGIKDVPASNSYFPYVLKLYKAGIINGQEGGNFNGAGPIKRGEAAAIIVRMVNAEKRL